MQAGYHFSSEDFYLVCFSVSNFNPYGDGPSYGAPVIDALSSLWPSSLSWRAIAALSVIVSSARTDAASFWSCLCSWRQDAHQQPVEVDVIAGIYCLSAYYFYCMIPTWINACNWKNIYMTIVSASYLYYIIYFSYVSTSTPHVHGYLMKTKSVS
jgi:hypothetical protein